MDWWKLVEDKAEEIGFFCRGTSYDDDFDFSISSPAGQDCHIEIRGTDLDNLQDNLYEYIKGYDVSYEAYIWLDNSGHGTNGAPYDMKDVYEDMEWLKNKAEELWKGLNEIGYEEDADE